MTYMMIVPFLLGITHCYELDPLLAVVTLDGSNSRSRKPLLIKRASWGVEHFIPVLICELGGTNAMISRVSTLFDQLKPIQLITALASIIYGTVIIYNHI